MNRHLARWLYHLAQDLRGEGVRGKLRELRETERWSAERLRALHWERLRAIVRHAWETVPYYREQWQAAGFEPGDLHSDADWDRLPLLSKEDLRQHGAALRSSRPVGGLTAATSGSSGQPVAVDRSHDSWGYAHAAVLRGWQWHGIDAGDPYAYLWGVPLAEDAARTARRKDLFFNRLRLNAFHIDSAATREFYGQLRRFGTRFAFGYPSALASFAREVQAAGLDGRALGWRVIISSAEVLHEHQRELLGEVFGCRVADSYGCAEIGVTGFECEHGGMHVPIETVRVDTVRVADGQREIVLTDLSNRNQPMLRYRVGDLTEAPGPSAEGICRCGRALPRLGRLQGRAGDTLHLPDGRTLNANLPSYIFKKHGKNRTIHEYQFIQHADGRVELRIVPGPRWVEGTRQELRSEVREVLGLDVEVHEVPEIERRGRAKHRDFIRAEDLQG